jgi:hypothetical protein
VGVAFVAAARFLGGQVFVSFISEIDPLPKSAGVECLGAHGLFLIFFFGDVFAAEHPRACHVHREAF